MFTPETNAGADKPDRFRLIHLSDPHLTPLSRVHWRELLNKRMLGWFSWTVRRHKIHLPGILADLQHDLQRHNPDHIAVTGDLTQIGTVSECSEAAAWLRRLGAPGDVSVIPGNHDCYAPADWDQTVGQWRDYMRGDDAGAIRSGTRRFPFLRHRGPAALIGLSTAVPTLPFFASGKLGRDQLESLDGMLGEAGRAGLFRIILLHHGPLAGSYSRRRSLLDAGEFREIVVNRGAELVLHGHGHRAAHGMLHGGASAIPVFGTPSASAASRQTARRAGYNIYDIAATGDGWRLETMMRSYDVDTGRFVNGAGHEFMLQTAGPVPGRLSA